MPQSHEQLEEMFALTASDPGAWVEQARGMRIAAEPIRESLYNVLFHSQSESDLRLKKLAYVRAYMLLMGCGFENLLKAIAAKRGRLTTSPNLSIDEGLSREKGGHSLTGLVRTLDLKLSTEENDYLQRLEEYVYWAGRYPVSLKRQIYVDAHSTGRLSFFSSDPALGSTLFDRLVKLAETFE